MQKKQSPLRKSQRIYVPFKRLIGIVGAFIGIPFCAVLFWWWIIPVNAIITKGHPFFTQLRVGKNQKEFWIIKFRSMKLEAAEIAPSDMTPEVQASMDTKFGKFLRKTSLDETPQLLNIFIGQMAFIGPRPGAAHNEEELIKLRKMYTPSAFDVKPGLSGYAQTRMNREHDPEGKAYYDSIYVQKMSLWFDIKVFVYTILKIFGAVKGR